MPWLAVLAVLLLPARSPAETYRFVDDKGVAHFTDRRENVPPEYLDIVEKVTEDRTVTKYEPSFYGGVQMRFMGMRRNVEERVDMFRSISKFASTNPRDVKASLKHLRYAFVFFFAAIVAIAVPVFKYLKIRPLRYVILVLALFVSYLFLYHMFKVDLYEHLDSVAEARALTEPQKEMFEKLLRNLY